MKNVFLVVMISLFFSACSDNADNSSSTTISVDNISDTENQTGAETSTTNVLAPKYYGKWTYVHSGEDINIISTTELNVTDVPNDENLLEVSIDDAKYYLVRSSISNTTITGTIESVGDSNITLAPSRGIGFRGIGGINIILKNVLDEKIKEQTVTKSDGSFTTTTLPSGTYNLSAVDKDNALETVVQIDNKENDIGIFKLTGDDLNNFKAELIINEDYILSNGNTYEAILRVHNISDNIGYGLSYDISLNTTEFVKSFSEGSINALGSVQAKSYKDIPISFSFDTLASNI